MVNNPEHMIGKPDGYPEKLAVSEIAERFSRLLGKFETPVVPLNIKVTGETELPGGIVKQRIEYCGDAGEIIPALHLFRKGLPANAPGVLSIHAHGGDEIFLVGKDLPVNKHRVYVTGLSMGGFGTWDLIERRPSFFAAAIPICARGDLAQAAKLKDLPIWAFHGDADPIVPVHS